MHYELNCSSEKKINTTHNYSVCDHFAMLFVVHAMVMTGMQWVHECDDDNLQLSCFNDAKL